MKESKEVSTGSKMGSSSSAVWMDAEWMDALVLGLKDPKVWLSGLVSSVAWLVAKS